MDLHVLQIIWYLVLSASVIFYTALDGFDLGVGALHLFAKNDNDRRVFLNAIGPVWDGNEVWLVVVGGGLFAGFPGAYASIFSGFYTPLMAFLAGIIFRAVAIEFRSKQESPQWRHFWDVSFSLASIVIALGIGLILGNLIEGIPLDFDGDFVGTFMDYISPFTLLVALLSLTLCTMHGAIYLLMKTDGDVHDHVRQFLVPSVSAFFAVYLATSIYTIIKLPYMTERMFDHPWLFVVPLLTFLAILNILRQALKGNDGWAFLSSCASIILLFSLFGLGTYPVILRSTVATAENSITLFNSSSGVLTLKVLLTIAIIGVPLVLAYGFWIYRIFRGKVVLDETSY